MDRLVLHFSFQYVKWTNDKSLGGIEGCLSKLKAADPTFGKRIKLSLGKGAPSTCSDSGSCLAWGRGTLGTVTELTLARGCVWGGDDSYFCVWNSG